MHALFFVSSVVFWLFCGKPIPEVPWSKDRFLYLGLTLGLSCAAALK